MVAIRNTNRKILDGSCEKKTAKTEGKVEKGNKKHAERIIVNIATVEQN